MSVGSVSGGNEPRYLYTGPPATKMETATGRPLSSSNVRDVVSISDAAKAALSAAEPQPSAHHGSLWDRLKDPSSRAKLMEEFKATIAAIKPDAPQVKVTRIEPSAESKLAAAELKSRLADHDKRMAEALKGGVTENNNLYLPNVASLSKEDAATIRDIVKSYAAERPGTMQVYAANGSEKTNSLAEYRKWLDGLI